MDSQVLSKVQEVFGHLPPELQGKIGACLEQYPPELRLTLLTKLRTSSHFQQYTELQGKDQ